MVVVAGAGVNIDIFWRG